MKIKEFLWRPIDTIGCHLVGPSFVGGHSIEEVLATGAELKTRGYRVTYNLLGEHFREQEKVDLTVRALGDLVAAMDYSNRGNVSIKPTQCGLQISCGLFYNKAEEIIDCGKRAGIETELDAEQSEFIPDTFSFFSQFASQFCYRYFVRLAVQAGLRQVLFLMHLYNIWDKQLRIVQGSGVYSEKTGIFIKDPGEILSRVQYIAARNYAEGQHPFIATVRNRKLVAASKLVLPKPAPGHPYTFEYEMLFGPLGVTLGEELLSEGYPVRMYIPFVVDWCKDEWKKYGMRRSAMIRRFMWEDKEVRRAIMREATKRLFPVAKK